VTKHQAFMKYSKRGLANVLYWFTEICSFPRINIKHCHKLLP